MEYFWYTEADIPEGAGFELFGAAHWAVMSAVLFIVLIVASIYKKRSERRRAILLVTAFLLPVIEVFKILFLIRVHRFGMGYLPLHLCSLSIYIYPVYAVLKKGKIKEFTGSFCSCVLLPAAISAIVFPDWTMYPVLSFMSLSSFTWHTLQIILPVCICAAKEVCPGIKDAVKSVIFLCILAVPVYVFDRISLCNYWFLLGPVPGPLEMLYNLSGQDLYLPALAAFTWIIVVIVQTIIKLFQRPWRQ